MIYIDNIDLIIEDLTHQCQLSSTFENVGISMSDDKYSASIGNFLATIVDNNGTIINESQLRTPPNRSSNVANLTACISIFRKLTDFRINNTRNI